MIVEIAVSAVVSFITAFILCKIFIPVLRKVKLGQKILAIGPNWHKSKEGTPIMGGLFFLTATMISVIIMLAFGVFDGASLFFPINLCFALLNSAIGFIDDYVKLFKKRNKGLTVMQKLILQFGVTAAYLASLKLTGCVDTVLNIPFTETTVDLGAFYYVIVAVVIVYIVNCANLTDGLDGLAGSIATVIAVLFLALACTLGEAYADMYITEAALIGGLVAFLIFNFYPAKVFMGDTGSLFLGAMLVTCAMRAGRPLIMLLIGFVYLIEGISVMLQVGYFKLTHGKRLFKMAPIHHHLELCGLSEVKIVALFLVITVAVCAAAFYILI